MPDTSNHISGTIAQKIQKFIDQRAKEMNRSSINHLKQVSVMIGQLNDYIGGVVHLTPKRIESLMNHLLGWYTITLDLPIPGNPGLKLLRARKFTGKDSKPCFPKVQDLSYIADKKIVSQGRLNKDGDSIFYGCIYFNDSFGGINVAFAEVDALQFERVNILRSKTNADIKVRFPGIFDYIRRETKPYFLGEEAFSYGKRIYEYTESKFDQNLFSAFLLCEAFFSDILRRKHSPRLYDVTSVLGSMLMEDDVDGVIYLSVQAEGSPVIALKTASVKMKVIHNSAESFEINDVYGYALYHATPLYQGDVKQEQKIEWKAML